MTKKKWFKNLITKIGKLSYEDMECSRRTQPVNAWGWTFQGWNVVQPWRDLPSAPRLAWPSSSFCRWHIPIYEKQIKIEINWLWNSKYSIEKAHRRQLWTLEIQMVNSSIESDVRFNDFSFFSLNFDHMSIGWRYTEKKYHIKVP